VNPRRIGADFKVFSRGYIRNRVGLFFAPSYDIANSKMLSTEYGVRIKSPCNC